MTGFTATIARQRDVELYTFSLTAEEILRWGKVDRFSEAADGVNRMLDEKHALEIAQAMTMPGTLMLDAICGDLKGDWDIKDSVLIPGEGAYLSIDDGQHRFVACDLLNPEERARWSFVINATKGLGYEERLRVFRQQAQRKPIDARLTLAQRHRLGDWLNDAERMAYELVLTLNSSPDSPLRGKIILGETVKRPYENGHKAVGINANGLWASLRTIMSRRSPLYSLSIEKRAEVANNMIRLASEIWPRAWNSDDHILNTARGINAVLMLMVSSPEFRGVIGEDFRMESLRRGLELAKSFKWHKNNHTNASVRQIVDGLNTSIRSGIQRQQNAGAAKIIA